ncbi:MAG: hypothetical protein A3H98_10745 [Bacteroidetes bacterium RIFCSPLOWO2_02_FULL_36_8]|nr:MAG: hypothetical protein A3H98_10745 [Bacteroidetes bacterium RIFCSPLOWO2_02_FULL_36_8]OFY71355.1 MAG: hypothetical protein A3G23_04165 [Bacteroidetes bacterium RIFCSPLOWO2_12_FULL_37_12]
MKVIITGVAGFIGSNLAKHLLSQNIKIIGIDNLSFGYMRNIKYLLKSTNFRFINADIRNENTFRGIRGEVLIHLASMKIPRYTNSLRTLEDNLAMVKNVVSYCIKHRCKLVMTSTSDVYGKNKQLPYSENSDLMLGPTTVKRWAYAVSKIYAEHYIQANAEANGLIYSIARLFGSYGPNQNLTWWGGPQSVFIQNILENNVLEIHGDGKQTRTFTFVDDTVSGLIFLIMDNRTNNQIYNIAGFPDEEIKIIDLAKLINSLIRGANSKLNYKLISYKNFGNYEDVLRRVPDINKISALGFSPRISLKEGMLRTIDWQKSLLKK